MREAEAVRKNFDLSTQAQRLEEIYLQVVVEAIDVKRLSEFGAWHKPAIAASIVIDLLAMPRLRDVLNPWLADVIHQYERQSVCVWPTELIHARASAIFGDSPLTGESLEL